MLSSGRRRDFVGGRIDAVLNSPLWHVRHHGPESFFGALGLAEAEMATSNHEELREKVSLPRKFLRNLMNFASLPP